MDNSIRKRLLKGLTMTMMLMLPNLHVKGEIIDNISTSIKDMSYQELNYKGVVTTNVNFRIGPGIDFDKILTIDKNNIVDILAIMENGWYLINYNNIIGFVSSDYVKIINMDIINQQIMNLPTIYKELIAKTDVNIREYPNVNSKKIGILKKGNSIELSKKYNEEWYECYLNNNICYISSKYVKEIYLVNGEYNKIVYCTNDTNLYEYPYSNIIDTIPKYEISKVFGEIEDYYLVECEGMAGYIKKSECELLNNRYIIVDISSQEMILCDGLDILLKSKIVTGKESTPTSLGIFSISKKEKNRILKGPDYETFVNYWMSFNGGQGFHDATWRHNFGGNIYLKNGSHGCVNLPRNFAAKLYDEVEVGNKVLIKK